MPKINREEYEVLKGLDDKWRWIARDGFTGIVNVYENKPRKIGLVKEWTPMGDRANKTIFKGNLFQFIQWEDEEPYNIAELIEEYEKDYKGSWEHAIEFSGEIFGESEETEVKKDIEWLISEIDQRVEAHKETTPYNTGVAIGMRSSLFLIDQLDEPEVLSEEWISDNAVVGQYPDGMGYVVPAYKLQNLLVPKQEELDRAYRRGFKEGERQTAEYFESITKEPSKEQVWKYLSEHGIEVVDKEPETVADVVTTFWKSYERLKEVMSMEVKELK